MFVASANSIVITAFLAVITSVLSNTFHQTGLLSGKIEEAVRPIDEANNRLNTSNDNLKSTLTLFEGTVSNIDSARDKLDDMDKSLNDTLGKSEYTQSSVRESLEELKLLQDNIIGASKGLRTAQSLLSIRQAAHNLDKSGLALKPVSGALSKMCDEIDGFHSVSLYPLHTEPMDSSQTETEPISDVISGLQYDSEDLPHYAYMAASIGRLFYSERIERYFPGTMLNVTTFAYYIRTIAEVVKSLEAWHDKFEFYTFMPKSPADLFRFKNSSDFKEWISFLESYNEFQVKNKGVWKRYFAYRPNGVVDINEKEDAKKRYKTLSDIKFDLNGAYVLTTTEDKKEPKWTPRKINATNIEAYLPGGFTPSGIKEIKDANEFHDEEGSVVTPVLKYNVDFSKEPEWRKLSDVLLEYHGLVAGAVKDEIDKKFVYRSVADITDGLDIKIQSTSYPDDKDNTIPSSLRTLKLPTDFFAIKEKNFENDGTWVYLIGFDDSLANDKSSVKIALSPVFDLKKMSKCTDENKKAAETIRAHLAKVFTEDKTVCKSHHELLSDGEKNV